MALRRLYQIHHNCSNRNIVNPPIASEISEIRCKANYNTGTRENVYNANLMKLREEENYKDDAKQG